MVNQEPDHDQYTRKIKNLEYTLQTRDKELRELLEEQEGFKAIIQTEQREKEVWMSQAQERPKEEEMKAVIEKKDSEIGIILQELQQARESYDDLMLKLQELEEERIQAFDQSLQVSQSLEDLSELKFYLSSKDIKDRISKIVQNLSNYTPPQLEQELQKIVAGTITSSSPTAQVRKLEREKQQLLLTVDQLKAEGIRIRRYYNSERQAHSTTLALLQDPSANISHHKDSHFARVEKALQADIANLTSRVENLHRDVQAKNAELHTLDQRHQSDITELTGKLRKEHEKYAQLSEIYESEKAKHESTRTEIDNLHGSFLEEAGKLQEFLHQQNETFTKKLHEMEQELSKAKEEGRRGKAMLGERDRAILQIQAEYQQLVEELAEKDNVKQEEFQGLEQALEATRGQLFQARSTIEGQLIQIQEKDQKIRQQQIEMNRLKTEVYEFDFKLKDIEVSGQSSLTQKIQETTVLQQQLQQAKSSILETQEKQAREIEYLKNSEAGLKQERDQLLLQIHQLHTHNQTLQQQSKDIQQEYQKVQKTLQKVKEDYQTEKLNESAKKNEILKTFKKLEVELDKYQGIEEEFDRLATDYEIVKQEVDEYRAARDQAEKANKELRKEYEKVEYENERLSDQVRYLQSNLVIKEQEAKTYREHQDNTKQFGNSEETQRQHREISKYKAQLEEICNELEKAVIAKIVKVGKGGMFERAVEIAQALILQVQQEPSDPQSAYRSLQHKYAQTIKQHIEDIQQLQALSQLDDDSIQKWAIKRWQNSELEVYHLRQQLAQFQTESPRENALKQAVISLADKFSEQLDISYTQSDPVVLINHLATLLQKSHNHSNCILQIETLQAKLSELWGKNDGLRDLQEENKRLSTQIQHLQAEIAYLHSHTSQQRDYDWGRTAGSTRNNSFNFPEPKSERKRIQNISNAHSHSYTVEQPEDYKLILLKRRTAALKELQETEQRNKSVDPAMRAYVRELNEALEAFPV